MLISTFGPARHHDVSFRLDLALRLLSCFASLVAFVGNLRLDVHLPFSSLAGLSAFYVNLGLDLVLRIYAAPCVSLVAVAAYAGNLRSDSSSPVFPVTPTCSETGPGVAAEVTGLGSHSDKRNTRSSIFFTRALPAWYRARAVS